MIISAALASASFQLILAGALSCSGRRDDDCETTKQIKIEEVFTDYYSYDRKDKFSNLPWV